MTPQRSIMRFLQGAAVAVAWLGVGVMVFMITAWLWRPFLPGTARDSAPLPLFAEAWCPPPSKAAVVAGRVTIAEKSGRSSVEVRNLDLRQYDVRLIGLNARDVIVSVDGSHSVHFLRPSTVRTIGYVHPELSVCYEIFPKGLGE